MQFLLLYYCYSQNSSSVPPLRNSASNQCGANSVTVAPWHAKSRPQMLVASKAAFLENYLAVSACILNGSSIEWHEKKRQPFNLSGVRFERRAILISG